MDLLAQTSKSSFIAEERWDFHDLLALQYINWVVVCTLLPQYSLFQSILEFPTRLRSNAYCLQTSRCKLPLLTLLLQSLAITLLLSASPPSLAIKHAWAKLLRVRLLFTTVVTLSVLTVDSVAGTWLTVLSSESLRKGVTNWPFILETWSSLIDLAMFTAPIARLSIADSLIDHYTYFLSFSA